MNEKMPFNPVGERDQADIDREAMAEKEAISLEEWSKKNLPETKVTFRWKYANKSFQLFERRLHSLAAFNVGPAIQAWSRSRLEWMRDERLFEKPNGVLVFSVDPEAAVDISLEDQVDPPAFSAADLVYEDGILRGCELDGSVWVVCDGQATIVPGPIRHAADTLVRDLVETFRLDIVSRDFTEADLEDAEVFFVSDEFGVIACEGKSGEVVEKMLKSFEKLWTLSK